MGLLRRLRQLVVRATPARPTQYPGTVVKVVLWLPVECAPVFGLMELQGTPRRFKKERLRQFKQAVQRLAGPLNGMEAMITRPPKVPTIIERG